MLSGTARVLHPRTRPRGCACGCVHARSTGSRGAGGRVARGPRWAAAVYLASNSAVLAMRGLEPLHTGMLALIESMVGPIRRVTHVRGDAAPRPNGRLASAA